MDVLHALENRYSCRAFTPENVPDEILVKILSSATRSPSWGNTQPWELFVATGDALKRLRNGFIEAGSRGEAPRPEMAAPRAWPEEMAGRTDFVRSERAKLMGVTINDPEAARKSQLMNLSFFGAPSVVYLCMDRTLTHWSLFDLGALSQSLMLAAMAYNVDSIPAVSLVHYPDIIRKGLSIPDSFTIVFGIALGFADRSQPQNMFRSPRRPVNEVARIISR